MTTTKKNTNRTKTVKSSKTVTQSSNPVVQAISYDIPVPALPPRKPSKLKYPFCDMKKGGSYFVPGKTANTFSLNSYYKRLNRPTKDKVFVKRNVVEDGVAGVRVFRVKD